MKTFSWLKHFVFHYVIIFLFYNFTYFCPHNYIFSWSRIFSFWNIDKLLRLFSSNFLVTAFNIISFFLRIHWILWNYILSKLFSFSISSFRFHRLLDDLFEMVWYIACLKWVQCLTTNYFSTCFTFGNSFLISIWKGILCFLIEWKNQFPEIIVCEERSFYRIRTAVKCFISLLTIFICNKNKFHLIQTFNDLN